MQPKLGSCCPASLPQEKRQCCRSTDKLAHHTSTCPPFDSAVTGVVMLIFSLLLGLVWTGTVMLM